MTSVSLVVWKMWPASSKLRRWASALMRLPLCATATWPSMYDSSSGWALQALEPPAVE